MLPYYKIERTNEGKEFFFSNIGYFNFWDEYLILNVGYKNWYTVLISRTKTDFHITQPTEDYKVVTNLYIEKSVRKREPKEMFVDFPELNEIHF